MVRWVVVATLLSIVAAFALPRKSVRVRYAGLSPKGRLQFFLFVGGVWVFAILFWIEVWREAQGQGGGDLFLVEGVGGFIVWALVLAATEVPDLWRGRSDQLKNPPGIYGRRFGLAFLSALPTLLVVFALMPLSLGANVLASRGVIDGRWFLLLSFCWLAGLVVVIVPLMGFNQPHFLVPPPLRGNPGLIPGAFERWRKARHRSHRTH